MAVVIQARSRYLRYLSIIRQVVLNAKRQECLGRGLTARHPDNIFLYRHKSVYCDLQRVVVDRGSCRGSIYAVKLLIPDLIHPSNNGSAFNLSSLWFG